MAVSGCLIVLGLMPAGLHRIKAALITCWPGRLMSLWIAVIEALAEAAKSSPPPRIA